VGWRETWGVFYRRALSFLPPPVVFFLCRFFFFFRFTLLFLFFCFFRFCVFVVRRDLDAHPDGFRTTDSDPNSFHQSCLSPSTGRLRPVLRRESPANREEERKTLPEQPRVDRSNPGPDDPGGKRRDRSRESQGGCLVLIGAGGSGDIEGFLPARAVN